MGISFSVLALRPRGLARARLFGFAGGASANRFYTDLEDWLSTTVRDLGVETADGKISAGLSTKMLAEFTAAIERLETMIDRNGSQEAHKATVQLADHLKSLVQHMRQEQQMVRDWVEDQGEQQTEIRKLLERLSRVPTTEKKR